MPPKKAIALSPSSGQVSDDKKTGSYIRTEYDHTRVAATRAKYGLTTELMQAIFEIIMRKYYIINRDIVLRQETNSENNDFQSVGSENIFVPTEADKKAIHAHMFEAIAGAESRMGQGNTYIPLDIILGLRQPVNASQDQLLRLLMGPYAANADTRRAFFEKKINSPTYSYLESQYIRFVASTASNGAPPASRVGLDFTYFGSGNRMAGLTLVEEPTGVFRTRIDSIDAHVSIEPSYRKIGAEFAGGKPRVTGWHFSNHHKSIGTTKKPSYENYYTFYTNYGHTMTHEQAEKESIRSATTVAAIAASAAPGGGGGGRFALLESPPGSPLRSTAVASAAAAAALPTNTATVADDSSLLLNNPFDSGKIEITIKPNGDIKYKLQESSGKKARMSKSTKAQTEKDFIGSEYFQLLVKDLSRSLVHINNNDVTGVNAAKEQLRNAIRNYEKEKYVAEQLPITLKYLSDMQKELIAYDGLKSKKAGILNPSIKFMAEEDVRGSAAREIEQLLVAKYPELFTPHVLIPALSRRLNFSDSPRRLTHPLSPSGSGIAGQRRTRNNRNTEGDDTTTLLPNNNENNNNEGSAAGSGGQGKPGYGGGYKRRRTRRP